MTSLEEKYFAIIFRWTLPSIRQLQRHSHFSIFQHLQNNVCYSNETMMKRADALAIFSRSGGYFAWYMYFWSRRGSGADTECVAPRLERVLRIIGKSTLHLRVAVCKVVQRSEILIGIAVRGRKESEVIAIINTASLSA